jgi:hypothetical protein
VAAILEGTLPNFYDAFTQLHLGQLLASDKCISRDRRNGGIDTSMDHIVWNSLSSSPRVDKDLSIGDIARHGV